jgi:hypothetical protein
LFFGNLLPDSISAIVERLKTFFENRPLELRFTCDSPLHFPFHHSIEYCFPITERVGFNHFDVHQGVKGPGYQDGTKNVDDFQWE